MLKANELFLVDRAVYYTTLQMVKMQEGSAWGQTWKLQHYLKEMHGWKDDYVRKMYELLGLNINMNDVYAAVEK